MKYFTTSPGTEEVLTTPRDQPVMNLHNSSRVVSPTRKSLVQRAVRPATIRDSYVLFSVTGNVHSIRPHCQAGCWLPGSCKCVASGKLRPRYAVTARARTKASDPSACPNAAGFHCSKNKATLICPGHLAENFSLFALFRGKFTSCSIQIDRMFAGILVPFVGGNCRWN